MKVYILWYDDWYEKELRKVFFSLKKAEEYRKEYIDEYCIGWDNPEHNFPITEHTVIE